MLCSFSSKTPCLRSRSQQCSRSVFGRKSERLEILGQESVFNEPEAEAEKETAEPEISESETETITYMRNKRKPGKLGEMLKGLPTRKEQNELPEEELVATFGESGWKRLPDEIYRKLEYHPATKEVVEHHIAVYAAKNENKIVRAPRPAGLLAHSVATPSLVAAVMNAKHMPASRRPPTNPANSRLRALTHTLRSAVHAICAMHCSMLQNMSAYGSRLSLPTSPRSEPRASITTLQSLT